MCDHGDREIPKKEHEKPREQLSQLLQNVFNEPPASGSLVSPRLTAPSQSVKSKSYRISVCRTSPSRAGAYRCASSHTGPVRPGPARSSQSHFGSGRPGQARPCVGRPGVSRPGPPCCYSAMRSKTFQVGPAAAKKSETLLFAGRYLTKVERANPFEVSKRFVGPQLKGNLNDCPDPERIVRKIFGVRNLTNVLLLITPSFEKQKDKHILHGYVIDGQRHLGVTSLTTPDKELIERTHKPRNYSIVYCSAYLELKDAYMNEKIKEKIFKTLSTQSMVPVCSFFKDKMLTLRYRCVPVVKKTCKPLSRVGSETSVLKKTESIALKPSRSASVSSICTRTQHSSQLTVTIYDQPTGEDNKINIDTTEESKGDCSKMEVASKPKGQVDYKTKIKQWREKLEKKNKLLKENQEQAKPRTVDKVEPKTKDPKREKCNSLPNRRQDVFSRNEDKNVKKFNVRKVVSKRDLKNEFANSQPRNYLNNKYANKKASPKPDELKRENLRLSQPRKIYQRNADERYRTYTCGESRHDETITASPKKTELQTRNPMYKRRINKTIDPKVQNSNKLEMENKSIDRKIRDAQLERALKEEYKKQKSDDHSMHMEGLPNLSHKEMRPPSIDTYQMELEDLQGELNKAPVQKEICSRAKTLDTAHETYQPARLETPESKRSRITVYKATLTKVNAPKIPRVRHSECSLKSRTSNLPTNFKRRVYERFGRWRDDFKVVVRPHRLRESKGAIHMPTISDQPTVKFHNALSIIEAKSVLFERLMAPVTLPEHFSKEACEHIRSRLVQIEAKQAFFKFDKLMRKINKKPVPLYRHLMTFFKFVMLLDIKLFVREEICWPGYAAALEPRYQVECYVFDDRKDFLVSFALLCRQLQEFTDLYPSLKGNLRFIDDALDLTVMPPLITKCLRSIMNVLHSRRLLQFLAEVTFDFIQPLPTPVNVHDEEPETKANKHVVHQKKRMEQALKTVKQAYCQTD